MERNIVNLGTVNYLEAVQNIIFIAVMVCGIVEFLKNYIKDNWETPKVLATVTLLVTLVCSVMQGDFIPPGIKAAFNTSALSLSVVHLGYSIIKDGIIKGIRKIIDMVATK